jgi:hypothetical protein
MLQSLRKDVKPVEKQSGLIKQVQYQIKQLEKQISQVGKTIQKISRGKRYKTISKRR